MSQSNGGFFYKVSAVVDRASFESGRKELERLEQSGKALAHGLAGAGTALVATAALAGNVAQQELKVAKSIGVGSEALNRWKTSASIAGANANGLVSAMSAIENKMQHLKTGTVDIGLAKNLGMLGLDYGNFAEMDSESRMRAVFNQADQMEDQRLAATLVGDILGQAGRDYYDALKLSGKSLDQQLAEAKQLDFVTEQSRKEASVFSSEIKAVYAAGKSIGAFLGNELGAQLTPIVRQIKQYLITNKEAIQKGITGVAKQTRSVFDGIAGAIGKIAPIVQGLIDRFGGLDQVIVKLAIGFGSLKLLQVSGGIVKIVQSINLLKAGIGGLATGLMGGALFLLIDDVLGYFQGKDSITGRIIDNFDKIKQKFEGMIPQDTIDTLVGSIRKLEEAFKNLDKAPIKEALGKIVQFSFEEFMRGITGAMKDLSDFIQLINAMQNGGIKGAWDFYQEKKKERDAGREEFMAALKGTEFGKGLNRVQLFDYERQYDLYHPVLGGGNGLLQGYFNAGNKVSGRMTFLETEEAIKNGQIKDGIVSPAGKVTQVPPDGWGSAIHNTGRIKDGIVAPGGRVTQVAPDDWVFAMRNVEDMARAFMPGGVTNNMGGMAISINQTINVESSDMMIPQTVRQQAYEGTADALRQNVRQAERFLQLMPGTR